MLTYLDEVQTYRDGVNVFGGINRQPTAEASQFYDLTNFRSDEFMYLSTRKNKYGIFRNTTTAKGLICKDALCYVDGTKFYINGYEVSGLTLDEVTNEDGGLMDYRAKKTLVSFGSYVLIFPDCVWVNTLTQEYGKMQNDYTTENDDGTAKTTTYKMCRADGSDFESGELMRQSTPPSVTGGIIPLWQDMSESGFPIKSYSSATQTWIKLETTYVKISAAGIDGGFEVGDGVAFSGIAPAQLSDLNGKASVIQAKGDDYIVIIGLISEDITQNTPITASRSLPLMDHVTECDNRLWGCRYGLARNGEVVNEIYASKLGDFKNFSVYEGISTDSYTASCGTDGAFTGAVTHLGYPVFFKENVIHKVYGNYPANYQIQTTICKGIQRGSGRSAAIVNGTLFYKARDAVMAYDGSMPAEVSKELGNLDNKTGVASCAYNAKYMLSVGDALYVYDTGYGLWHKESAKAKELCAVDNEVYFVDEGNKLCTLLNTGDTEAENKIEWSAVSRVMGMQDTENRYVSRVIVKYTAERGAKIRTFIQYNGETQFKPLSTSVGAGTIRTESIIIRPTRNRCFRLKLEGEGAVTFTAMNTVYEVGSDD